MTYECYCDYDPPEFITCRVQIARKIHVCEECGGKIVPGATYEYVAGRWDGHFDTFKTCHHCLSLREWAGISVPCFCWSFGNLLQNIRDMVDEVKYEVPGFFFEYGRQVIKAKRERIM